MAKSVARLLTSFIKKRDELSALPGLQRENERGEVAARFAHCGSGIVTKLMVTCAIGFAALSTAGAGILTDGDFAGWSLSSINNGSMTLEATGGNPGARLNATTSTFVGGPAAYDLAINASFSTTAPLSGAYTLGLQILRGPGDFGAGQSIGLLVQQGSDIYLQSLGITGSGHTTFDPISFNGDFTAASFTHLSGTGAALPNFSGTTATNFGFAAINANNNQSVTEYYDNFSLTHAAVPEPSISLLLACGMCASAIFRRPRSGWNSARMKSRD